MQSTESLSALLLRQAERELQVLETATSALEAAHAAAKTEAEIFVRWFRREAHGNTYRAAERRYDRAAEAAYDAVHAAGRLDERIREAWGLDVFGDDVLAVVTAVRDEARAEIERRRVELER